MPQTGLGAAAAALALALSLPAAAQPLSDTAIGGRVHDKLAADSAVPATPIQVMVQNRVVTLGGTVDSLLARQRAERLAETIRGVTMVNNELMVVPETDRKPDVIRDMIAAAIAANPALEADRIEVAVSADGAATLTGTVDSGRERLIAGKVAAGVGGVRRLDNNLTIAHVGDRPAEEIAADVQGALRWNALVDHALIDVAVDDDRVTLSGMVGSAAERRQAILSAWTAGVESVGADDLVVDAAAGRADLRADKYTKVPDGAIEQAVVAAIARSPAVDAGTITVDVVDGVAELDGTVDDLASARAARRVARTTVGVTSVVDDLSVTAETYGNPGNIVARVHRAVRADPYLEAREIRAGTGEVPGSVILSGTVDSWFERAWADQVAADVVGVATVDNNLAVNAVELTPLTSDPYVAETDPQDYGWYPYAWTPSADADREIHAEIVDELWWSPFVDSDDVRVSVEDGVATLTGSVESWGEYRAARENALEGGARWVINRLAVR